MRLGDYPTTPLYNIKAVVQATGISSSTLRAWERRYNMCAPYRSASGYRLYSERDIAIIRWLKQQVDAGMSISQAVAWLDKLSEEVGGQDNALLPTATDDPVGTLTALPMHRSAVRDLFSLQQELLHSLLHFDKVAADQLMAEAFALYTIEQVGEELVTPLLVEIGERWHRGDVSITTEHYISTYLLQRLMMLLHATPATSRGQDIWVGCAPSELHEVGPLLLAVFLRRAGFHVHYLGRNLPADDLVQEVRRRQPAMVLFSAGSEEAVHGLQRIVARLDQPGAGGPIIGVGGRIFNENPHLQTDSAGLFLGRSAQGAVGAVAQLLHGDGRTKARQQTHPAGQPSRSRGAE